MACYALLSGKHLPTFQRTAHLQGKAFQKNHSSSIAWHCRWWPRYIPPTVKHALLRPITSFKKTGNLKLVYFTSLYSVHVMWNYVQEELWTFLDPNTVHFKSKNNSVLLFNVPTFMYQWRSVLLLVVTLYVEFIIGASEILTYPQ
jgi:hypothetical protein